MSLPVSQSRPFLSEQETDLAKERSFGQANMPSIVSKITKFSRIVTINQINHLNLKKYPLFVSNRWKNQRIFVNGREFPFIHFQSNFDYIRIFLLSNCKNNFFTLNDASVRSAGSIKNFIIPFLCLHMQNV